MKKILVLGGTRFFGRRLVQMLVAAGADVTIATRGRVEDPFGNMVKRVRLDRDQRESLAQAVGQNEWDIVYDNICYSPQNAMDACHVFSGKVGRYVFTSTRSVYDYSPRPQVEADFDPYMYPVVPGDRSMFSYQEGKRLAEAVFFQSAAFPVVAVRFPIVLGEDDYTRRLEFHIERISCGSEIGLPNADAALSFIHSEEAAHFLAWLGDKQLEGPVNACSAGTVSVARIVSLIEKAVGKPAIVKRKTAEQHISPFAVPDSACMDTTKAIRAGYTFRQLEDWLPPLIHTLASSTVSHENQG